MSKYLLTHARKVVIREKVKEEKKPRQNSDISRNGKFLSFLGTSEGRKSFPRILFLEWLLLEKPRR